MNEFYDHEEARDLVERTAKYRLDNDPKELQLQQFQKEGGIIDHCYATSIGRPKAHKLTKSAGNGEGNEEIVLRLQGILCHKAIPPFGKRDRIEPSQRQFMRQSITLTGCGGNTFLSCIESIQEIQHLLGREFPEGSMEEWVPSSYRNNHAIDIGNRYFTRMQDIGHQTPISFNASIDPYRKLTDAMGNEFVHLEENEVKYLHLIRGADERDRYVPLDPVRLRTGDIVEAQVSFTAVPLKGRRHKMLLVLRAVTLLDSSAVHNSQILKSANAIRPSTPLNLMKRKVGYADDEEGETVEKVARMELL